MYLSTPLGRVIALDADTGEELWVHDARIDRFESYGDFASRGVSIWVDPALVAAASTGSGRVDPSTRSTSGCDRRIFAATIDARLIALDAADGRPCQDFGGSGQIDLRRGLRIAPFEYPAYQVTSPPLVVGDLVITGSAIADNSRRAPASGEVRAFDVRTGQLRWSWDPIPQTPLDPAFETWQEGSPALTGSANVWSVMTADPQRGLVFAPTSSPAPDYYGGLRKGAGRYGNSIVALDAQTGKVVWDFQTVHHDLWDYDNASPPALVTLRRSGEPDGGPQAEIEIPAVLQATKTGMLFVLHRETGEALFEVEERPVPASDVPGEETWPTQPFTAAIHPLSPHQVTPEDAFGVTEEEREACREILGALRNEGIFTPPSLQGTLVMPSTIGGAHWGGLTFDPVRQIAVVPVNRHAAMVQLIPAEGFSRDSAEAESGRLGLGYEYNIMVGTPYAMRRRSLRSPSGIPCTPPPFGALVAVSLATGERLWETPLGRMPVGDSETLRLLPDNAGSINLGGPIATAGGLVFIASTDDPALRAFDIDTGEELWKAELPAIGQATPMTYRGPSGRQYVVIAAAGGGSHGEGDYLVAFALPRR
jgi:quinoprotein glucose dehydrogenase